MMESAHRVAALYDQCAGAYELGQRHGVVIHRSGDRLHAFDLGGQSTLGELEASFARYVVPERDGLRARLDVGAGAW